LRLKVLSIFGTRPEAIKMAPVIRELGRYGRELESIVSVTAQHREMLDQVLDLFGIRPDFDLNLMEQDQNLPELTARAVTSISEVLERVRPGLVLVQGDTTTALAGALAAFYLKVPVGHVEAGLRTQNRYRPFPEEINRRLVSVLATIHFAPSEAAAAALRIEGVPREEVHVTGNPVIDSFLWIVSRPPSSETTQVLEGLGWGERETQEDLAPGVNGRKLILVTAHRRENFGRPLENICSAVRALVRRNPDVEVVYPVHPNPNVCEPVRRMIGHQERIHLTEPLAYEPFCFLMRRAYLILTDSGGIQEEAPALGKPVLVLRTETERLEAVQAGTVKLVGVESESILSDAERLLTDRAEYERMATAFNPYGDGHAAERIVRAILEVATVGFKTRPVSSLGPASPLLRKRQSARPERPVIPSA
jgi:UDP-N-acetylglucosamine 2-epimerase (non-hydrolysing)